jgi:branched-chain amino acid transport system permease protein
MFSYIFSGDFPRSKLLTLLLVVIVVGLVLTPWLFPGSRSMETAMRIAIFIVLVASYDLLLGYTGIVSFAHTMFFGIGAYGVAITLNEMGRGYDAIFIGTALGFVGSVLLAFLIGLFSLRVKAIFFAMVTLAVASAFTLLVSQLYQFTGGEDGLTYSIPRELSPAFKLMKEKVFVVLLHPVCVLWLVPVHVAGGEFTVRARLAGDPRKRISCRSHWLSHGDLPHSHQLSCRRYGSTCW